MSHPTSQPLIVTNPSEVLNNDHHKCHCNHQHLLYHPIMNIILNNVHCKYHCNHSLNLKTTAPANDYLYSTFTITAASYLLCANISKAILSAFNKQCRNVHEPGMPVTPIVVVLSGAPTDAPIVMTLFGMTLVCCWL